MESLQSAPGCTHGAAFASGCRGVDCLHGEVEKFRSCCGCLSSESSAVDGMKDYAKEAYANVVGCSQCNFVVWCN